MQGVEIKYNYEIWTYFHLFISINGFIDIIEHS